MTDNKINSTGYYTPDIQSQYSRCVHLLPCGICERTNQICPLNGYKPSWTTEGPSWVNFNQCCDTKKRDN